MRSIEEPQGELYWPVNAAGYEWQPVVGADGRRSYWLRPNPTDHRPRLYRPMVDEPRLIRIVADLDLDDLEAIRRFTDKYGLLFPVEQKLVSAESDGEPEQIVETTIADADDIREHLSFLQDCVDSLDYVMGRRRAMLEPRFNPSGRQSEFARQAVGQSLARRLSTHLLVSLRPKVSFTCDGGIPEGQFRYELGVPTDLFTVLVHQLACACVGEVDFRRCEYRQCRKWIRFDRAQVQTRRRRRDARFCDARCRAEAHQTWRNEAAALHASGLSVMEIAKRMQQDVKSVRSWLQQAKKRRAFLRKGRHRPGR